MAAPLISDPVPSGGDLSGLPEAGERPGKPLLTAEALRRSASLAAWWHLARSYHCLSQRFTQYLEGFKLTGRSWASCAAWARQGRKG